MLRGKNANLKLKRSAGKTGNIAPKGVCEIGLKQALLSRLFFVGAKLFGRYLLAVALFDNSHGHLAWLLSAAPYIFLGFEKFRAVLVQRAGRRPPPET